MRNLIFKGRVMLALVFLAVLVGGAGTVSAAHFITGNVNDALDGTGVDGYIITLWNPANGKEDNLTDIIGPEGNSGEENTYFIDCELLDSPCGVGDEIRVKVFNNGSDYITQEQNLTVTGAGFDVMENLTLNSPPNASLNFPVNGANYSSSSVEFMCSASDLDGNLANMTLYGNWSGGWHANETLETTGAENSTNFTKGLGEGVYKWSCYVSDSLSISNFAEDNYTLTVDLTPPNVSSVELNLTGSVCGIDEIVRVNCTAVDELTGVESVWIEGERDNGNSSNFSAEVLSGDTYFSDIALDEIAVWNFTCYANDSAGNVESLDASDNVVVRTDDIDLTLQSSDIVFGNLDPIENENVLINATIHNEGCADSGDFLAGFFEEDPDSGGVQINGNRTVNIAGLSNETINVSWSAGIGTTNIFVKADLNDSVSESDESNNKANKSISVNAWQEFYGNVSVDKLLGDNSVRNLSLWYNESFLTGNIFITDSESDVSWSSLLAIGKNSSGGNTTNDFGEIDDILNMTLFSDSVSNTFTSDGSTPLGVEGFLVHQENITGVPVVNSTNSTNFVTGILWDSSDDNDGEFSIGDKEDLVFAAKVNESSQGGYGIYDYEAGIPVRLREYYTSDLSDVFIYFDLN